MILEMDGPAPAWLESPGRLLGDGQSK